jgi:hypothetical protein
MKSEQMMVFTTTDGKRFFDEKEAQRHEESLQNTKYYKVRYNPDLNETGYFQKEGFIVCNARCGNELYVEDWLYKSYGSTVAYIQGSAPTKNWNYYEIERSKVDFSKIIGTITR